MAMRPVYLSLNYDDTFNFVDEKMIDFEWFPGFSIKQKQKSISALHDSIYTLNENVNILEISSKSPVKLGVMLSAFNLTITHKNTNEVFTVESAFQASKVFEKGGPFIDILKLSSKEAKRDMRLKTSGKLKCFKFYNTTWNLEPKTLFYDWLYINALSKHENLSKQVVEYNAFTDIEFNPQRSVNCQAKSAALYASLYHSNLLEQALQSKEKYIEIITSNPKIYRENKNNTKEHVQLRLDI